MKRILNLILIALTLLAVCNERASAQNTSTYLLSQDVMVNAGAESVKLVYRFCEKGTYIY